MIEYLSLQEQKRAQYNNTRHLRYNISVFTHNSFRELAMKSPIFNQSSDVIEGGIHLAMIEYNPPQRSLARFTKTYIRVIGCHTSGFDGARFDVKLRM